MRNLGTGGVRVLAAAAMLTAAAVVPPAGSATGSVAAAARSSSSQAGASPKAAPKAKFRLRLRGLPAGPAPVVSIRSKGRSGKYAKIRSRSTSRVVVVFSRAGRYRLVVRPVQRSGEQVSPRQRRTTVRVVGNRGRWRAFPDTGRMRFTHTLPQSEDPTSEQDPPTGPLLPLPTDPSTDPRAGYVIGGSPQFEAEVLRLTNEARAVGRDCGGGLPWYPTAPSVQPDDRLAEVARLHSKDMAERNYFSHDTLGATTTPGGNSYRTRVQLWPSHWSWSGAGDNIGAGYPTPGHVVQGWLDSPLHCRNLMDPLWTHLGVGYWGAEPTQGEMWPEVRWVQNFAAVVPLTDEERQWLIQSGEAPPQVCQPPDYTECHTDGWTPQEPGTTG